MVKFSAGYVLKKSTLIIMAKSSTYFGLRRGSTKSHTYSVVDGKQITKDRVEGGKDPRTLPQMTQRCLVATIGSAYSAMKSICDHSFEGKSAGMQCMREFMSTNLKLTARSDSSSTRSRRSSPAATSSQRVLFPRHSLTQRSTASA